MRFIDLFCGLGGFRLAFENHGAQCVYSSDFDLNVCKTYLDNFNDYPYSDITKVSATDIPDFDILCGGFPCQPFSIGGLRKGFNDTRGTLFFDIERIIREKKPKAFILENVKGLVNHDKGNTLSVILNKLGTTINGEINSNSFDDCLNYNVFYSVLNSKNFGLPQNRERVFIIGFSDPNVSFDFKSTNAVKKKYLNDIIENNVENPKLYISENVSKQIDKHLQNRKDFNLIRNKESLIAFEVRKSRCAFRFDNLSPTLTAKMGTGGNNIPILVKLGRKLSVRECLRIQGFPETYNVPQNSHGYKQIGNSVSVPVIDFLAKKIIASISV